MWLDRAFRDRHRLTLSFAWTPTHPPTPTLQTFLKAICANWFVCLAVWQCLGANSFGGKFIACLGPVSAFVCIG